MSHKELMKRSGTYTPAAYEQWKIAQGYSIKSHGQRKPRKWRAGTVDDTRLAFARSKRMHGGRG